MSEVQWDREKILSRLGKLDDDQLKKIAPCIDDLIEAVTKGRDLSKLDREDFREDLGIGDSLPNPIITVLDGIVLPGTGWNARWGETGCNRESRDITEANLPLTLPPGPRNLVLVHFDVSTDYEKVERWAKENSYGLAVIDDLFAVAAHPEYANLQLKFDIIALGASISTERSTYIVCLREGDDGERVIDTDCMPISGFEEAWYLLVRVSL